MRQLGTIMATVASVASLIVSVVIFITVRNEHHQMLDHVDLLADRVTSVQTEIRYGSMRAAVISAEALRQQVSCPAAGARTLVLLAIGQSNASNYAAERSRSAHGDHVVEFFHGRCYLGEDPSIGGDGYGGSAWIKLANLLIDRGVYDDVVVSVAAVGGSSIREWRYGGAYNPRIIDIETALVAARMPVTAVAWVQGEAESAPSAEYNDRDRYAQALTEVIATARQYAPQSNFYVATTSWCPSPVSRINPSIRAAQASVVQPANGVFQGPDLDAISNYEDRFDVCHLSSIGLQKFVARWADIIDPRNPTVTAAITKP